MTDDDRFTIVDALPDGDGDSHHEADADGDADDLDPARVRRAATARRAAHRQRAWLSTAALVMAILAVQMAGSSVADARGHGLTARPLLSAGLCLAATAAAWVFRRRASGLGREIDAAKAGDDADPDFTGLGSATADERFDGLRRDSPQEARRREE